MAGLVRFKLDFDISHRPLFMANGVRCIFDPGSYITVIGEKFADLFGENYQISRAPLSGFGGNRGLLPMYKWDNFTLRQGNTIIELKRMVALVDDKPILPLVLSPYYFYETYAVANKQLAIGYEGPIQCQRRDFLWPVQFDNAKDLMLYMNKCLLMDTVEE